MSERIAIEDFGYGAGALQRLREATDAICDVTTPNSADEFRMGSSTVQLGQALLIKSQVSAVEYVRTPRHVARSGLDHYQLAFYLDGTHTFTSGRRQAALQPGDVCIVDMTQANRFSAVPDPQRRIGRGLSLVLPRSRLAPLLATPDAVSARMLSRATREGQLVAGELLSLYDRRETLAPGEAEAAVDAVLDVVARAVGAARHATAAEYGERHLLTAAIKRHLDAHLTAEQIDVGALCRRFRLSRATLYRLFEPDGGLWRYVQDQRLNRAFARLATPGAPLERMIDLAIEFGFSSDTTFVRAFRHRHGLTPGEVRELAGSRTRPSAPHSQWTSGAWLQDLAQK